MATTAEYVAGGAILVGGVWYFTQGRTIAGVTVPPFLFGLPKDAERFLGIGRTHPPISTPGASFQLGPATVGRPYQGTITLSGGGATVQVQGLPPGLHVSAQSGGRWIVSGTPTQAGSYPVSIGITAQSGMSLMVTVRLTVQAARTASVPPGAGGKNLQVAPAGTPASNTEALRLTRPLSARQLASIYGTTVAELAALNPGPKATYILAHPNTLLAPGNVLVVPRPRHAA